VSFEDKSLWEQHYLAILVTCTIVAAQALAIAALLAERQRRTRAEQSARSRMLEVVHLNQSATAGALSASIAHELNQPLGAIRNNTRAAELVLKSANPDLRLMEQILADIRDDDQRASDIITGLRGMLKKRSEIEWQELDVNDVVANALQILHSEAERRRVEIDFHRPTNKLPVRVDRVHLQQVILNLATNAMDAMLEAAERKLMLETGIAEAGQVGVSIADSGTGIPKEKLARIFETFYTTKAGGTGLGLSIARTVVESYGGRIWAENRPEGGAIVRFVLPMVQAS
jgi:C4-dicarboxylate-specific signal transduction histidine kinase